MRKKEYWPWLPVVRLAHSSSRLYRASMGSEMMPNPCFFARSKNLAGTLPQGFYQSLFFSGSGFRLSAF
ncbi:hypothetical protein ACSE5K_01285 [Bacillus velezensis]|uniref:hypothetical protein n=1 Tax=Bacillus TaxID=1386 RepID=UPI0011155F06|nr:MULTISPECIES: hypothetical protein [Bacillus]MDH2303437.1 hypothetical protein [Bacillus velezensis]MDR4962189.1 hypothetical protein [Bacillus velezensis]MEC2162407.1 hypothetical protein [Bacillus velezensis]MEC2193381.1 hypothetical protein [Bacillus velezensis]UVF87996.1 hypothetical protein NWE25_01280 [Bacillus velezensis]